MDKVFSARLDEESIAQLEALAQSLKTTKKSILEQAIDSFAQQVSARHDVDVLSLSAGAWNRKESAAATVKKAKSAFRESFTRRRSR